MTGSRLRQLAGLTLLAAALAYGLHEVGDGIRARDARDVVTVTGSAKRTISSDYVIWDSSVSVQNLSPAVAARKLAGWTSAIRSFLRDAGVKPSELVVAPISTETITSSGGKLVGYNLTRSFEIRSVRMDATIAVIEIGRASCRERV